MDPLGEADLRDLIDRYQSDVEYLSESGDADDKIVAGVLTDVLGDLRKHLW